MRHKYPHLKAAWILIIPVIPLAVGSLWLVIDPRVQSRRIERAIRQFATAPSQTGADELMEQLGNGLATTDQGERILRLLLEPTITTRESYPMGQPASISTEFPFRSHTPHATVKLDAKIRGPGASSYFEYGTKTITTIPHILTVCPPSQPPVVHWFEIAYDCTVTHQRYHRSAWNRFCVYVTHLLNRSSLAMHFQMTTTYHCHFTVLTQITVMAKETAERVALVSDSETDKAMRAIATAKVQADQHDVYWTASGGRGYRGSPIITFEALPIAVAWQVSLRLADGRELPQDATRQAQRIRFRAGDNAECVVNVGCFGIDEPGNYSGTLILRPDPNCAYEDPAIKSMWNGILEFPVSFVVYVKTTTQ